MLVYHTTTRAKARRILKHGLQREHQRITLPVIKTRDRQGPKDGLRGWVFGRQDSDLSDACEGLWEMPGR